MSEIGNRKCEPDLKIGITRAILKTSGTTPEANERLYKICNGFEMTMFRVLRTETGML